MEIFKKAIEIQEHINQLKIFGKKIGFVPTMGALHKGHLSLIETAKRGCDVVVVSIFVNPTQFNDKDDFLKYPRNDEKDLAILSEISCDVVFMPDVNEMYPEPDNRIFNLGDLEIIMEGKFRPGHFQGVAKVCSKLFDIVRPDVAYFGEKDFQQLAVIKKMVQLLCLKVEIVGCPTIREENGLAMSSRNQRLSSREFSEASVIFKTLKGLKEIIRNVSLKKAKIWAEEAINNSPGFKIEYVEIVDNESLTILNEWPESGKSVTCCVAVFCGKVRLIDNIKIYL